MDDGAGPDRARRRVRHRLSQEVNRWSVAAVVLLVTATGAFTVGLRDRDDAPASPIAARLAPDTPATGPATTAPRATKAARSNEALAGAAPVALEIPAIDLSVSLSELGLRPDGTVQVPTDFQEPGWFRLGPSPGELGSAVILGHVDSYEGPAVFFRLRLLEEGDQVEVSLADGAVAHFVVTAVAMYPKAEFPAEQVYASHGYRALQLVTCGGDFDYDTRSYLSNVVAYTSLLNITPAGSPVGGDR